jgi:peroxiredoxin
VVVKALFMLSLVALSACAARGPTVATVPHVALESPKGAGVDTRAISADAKYTVLVFFSAHCPCQRAHDARLHAMADAYAARGVVFAAVDSEVQATPERDAGEAAKRGYSYPILVDRGAALAKSLGADYATYTVVFDRDGRIRYHGGLDSDRRTLHDDATFYLRDALDDLLSGRDPRVASGKTLGCALETW